MIRALRAEFLKLKRARMPLWTALAVLVYAGLDYVIMRAFILRYDGPKTLAGGGPVFARAVAAGMFERTWENLLRMGTWGISGAWGILTFSLVAAYVFGREYRERTAPAAFTLPVRREAIVVSKTVVVAVWVLGLTLLTWILQIGVVALLGARGFGWPELVRNLVDSLTVSALLFLTLPAVALLAASRKGYLPPMLFALAMMMVQTGISSTPASPFFPWTAAVLVAGASWMPIPSSPLGSVSWVTAFAFFLACLAAQLWRVDHADAPV